jgi:ribose transport system permease protein
MGLSGGGEGVAVAIAFTLMIAGGAAAGTVNGLLVSLGRIAPFIVTLGGFAAFRSIALTAAESGEVRYGGAGAFSWLGTTGIPIPGTNIAGRFATEPVPLKLYWSILIFLSVAALGWVLLNRTRFGRYTIAIGANERAALYSAVPVRTVKTLVYVLMGALVGLAALMLTSRMNSIGSGSAGVMLELDAIAAVVVGGTRLSGGRGSIAGTVFGVLIMGVIPNMMVMLNIDSNLQGLVKGAVIVLAVLIQKKA